MNTRSLVICGGGPVGLLAAVLLADRFEQVSVLEKRSPGQGQMDSVSRSLQLVLSERGWAALERGGLASAVRSHAQAVRGRVGFDTNEFSPYSPQGEAIYAVARDRLQTILEQAVSALPNARLLHGHEVRGLDGSTRVVSCNRPNGLAQIPFDLLIGADGIRSAIATAIQPPGGEVLQKAHEVYREIHFPQWPFRADAFHFVGDGEVLVGGFPDNRGGGGLFIMHRPGAESTLFAATSGRSVLDRFPCLRPVLTQSHLDAWAAVSPGVMGSKTCERWHAHGSVVLAGDAAHAIQPFMGQGLNTGLEDVLVLSDCLGAMDQGRDPLARYTSLRKPEAEAIRAMSDQHASMLFGSQTEEEVAFEARVQQGLQQRGWPDSYCAAAFTRTPFTVVLQREQQVRSSMLSARGSTSVQPVACRP